MTGEVFGKERGKGGGNTCSSILSVIDLSPRFELDDTSEFASRCNEEEICS